MSELQTYTIGRQDGCEIRLTDKSVSRRHAELVRGHSGKLLLMDCNSSLGTFVHGDQGWTRIRQAEVRKADRVRFGDYEAVAGDLIGKVTGPGQRDRAEGGSAQVSATDLPPDDRPIGAVRRDPVTGSIVSVE